MIYAIYIKLTRKTILIHSFYIVIMHSLQFVVFTLLVAVFIGPVRLAVLQEDEQISTTSSSPTPVMDHMTTGPPESNEKMQFETKFSFAKGEVVESVTSTNLPFPVSFSYGMNGSEFRSFFEIDQKDLAKYQTAKIKIELVLD